EPCCGSPTGARRSARAAGVPPVTTPPGSPPTAPRPSPATSWGSRVTSSWRAAKGTRSWSSCGRRRSTRVRRRAPSDKGGSMADEGRQKDAMDVLQAWVDQYNGRAGATIQELGSLGGAVSQAKAVNNLGHVAGTSRDGSGRSRAFLWKEAVGITDLNPLTGVNASANDINAMGDIVGGGDTGFGDFHAYF